MTDVMQQIWDRIYALEEQMAQVMEAVGMKDSVQQQPEAYSLTMTNDEWKWAQPSCICAERLGEIQSHDIDSYRRVVFICPAHGLKVIYGTKEGGDAGEGE